ncbi:MULTISPECIES: restriction endonuclease subunit S [Enterococcus]|uniref:restriction endonuclease subunit S n=1 Tax=Enterococcus TaxID=1350 RepID=UPI001C117850|nr:restriction endonuclease subunit S [Enterococcus avium]MBU5368403.1 restriction endonuclease subunit S [Enterococcus avium]
MAKIDDSVKKKVPELRFKGFTDEWEERKFADFIDVKSGKDYKHLNSGSIPVYGTGGYMLSVDRALSDTDAIGIGRKGTIDKPYLLKAPFWTVDTLFYAVPKQNIDLQFSLSIFKKINWKKFDESTGVPSLSKTVINSVSVSVPNFEEQQKIGSFFKQLDDTIALHQRKLDLLKETKKGFLQKMFPKNGAKVPEIRFPGFTEDWEQRKLGQVANYRRGSFPQPYGNKEWYDGENSMPFVQVVDVGDNLRLVEDTKQKISELAQPKSVFVEEGKVVVTLQGSIGRVAITQYPAYVDRTLLIFESYKAEMDEYYFAYVIQQLFEYEKTRAPGGTIKTITKEALSNFTISFPSIAEQKKLGKFFEQLDDTIALHQRKLDLLKEQKKGFLQKMFV